MVRSVSVIHEKKEPYALGLSGEQKRAMEPGPCSLPSHPSLASPRKKWSDVHTSFGFRSTTMSLPAPPYGSMSFAGRSCPGKCV